MHFDTILTGVRGQSGQVSSNWKVPSGCESCFSPSSMQGDSCITISELPPAMLQSKATSAGWILGRWHHLGLHWPQKLAPSKSSLWQKVFGNSHCSFAQSSLFLLLRKKEAAYCLFSLFLTADVYDTHCSSAEQDPWPFSFTHTASITPKSPALNNKGDSNAQKLDIAEITSWHWLSALTHTKSPLADIWPGWCLKWTCHWIQLTIRIYSAQPVWQQWHDSQC